MRLGSGLTDALGDDWAGLIGPTHGREGCALVGACTEDDAVIKEEYGAVAAAQQEADVLVRLAHVLFKREREKPCGRRFRSGNYGRCNDEKSEDAESLEREH